MVETYAADDGEDRTLDKILAGDDNIDCYNCKHLIAGTSRCKAFPDGIPIEILSGPVVHNKDIEGDNGIRWKKKV